MSRSRFGVLALALTLVIACAEKGAGPNEPSQPIPVATLVASPSDSIFLGESITLSHDCKYATSSTPSWPSSSNMKGDDIVTPSTSGLVEYFYVCANVSGADTARVTVRVLRHLRLFGTLHADFPVDFSNHRVYIQKGALIDSIDVAPSGSYDISTRFTDGDCVDVIVDEKDRVHRIFFRSEATGADQLCAADYHKNWSLDRFMIERTIERGSNAGKTFRMSLVSAFETDSVDMSFLPRKKNVTVGGGWEYIYRFSVYESPPWLAFDRERSTTGTTITPSDSIGAVNNAAHLFGEFGPIFSGWTDFADVGFIPWTHGEQGDLGGSWNGLLIRIDPAKLDGVSTVVDSNSYFKQGLLYLPHAEDLSIGGGYGCDHCLGHELVHALWGIGHFPGRGLMSNRPNGLDPLYGKITLEEHAYIDFLIEYGPIRLKLTNACSIHYAWKGDMDMEGIPMGQRDPIPCKKN